MKRALCFLCLCILYFPAPSFAAEPDRLILINLATNQLSYFENGQYMRTFPISSGKKQTPTPEGKFTVINKYKNKRYNRKNIEGGALNNPLGTRWMGLNYKEYAIHGTNRESTIGSYESNGCIRMNDRNIQWLYDRIPLRTKVVITKFYGSAEQAAHRFGYRVISWNGEKVEENQVGKLLTIDRTKLYWQEPNGQLIVVQTVMPNQVHPVFSHNGKGTYYIGNNLYIVDPFHESVKYTQVPDYIIANQYKRQRGIQ
ncbi:MAG: L,D-transpeptidase [Ectobacillus sp.]